MKATGITRRLDNLGRIVIPKEIRRTLRIREGDPMEIFTDNDGGIILRKYSPISELGDVARQYAQALSQTTGHTVCISDRDIVVAAAGDARKDLEDKSISRELQNAIDERKTCIMNRKDKSYINVTNNGYEEFSSGVVGTIICEGDAMGAVIILGKEEDTHIGEVELKLVKSAAQFLGKQMEA